MTVQELREQKKLYGYTNQQIARLSGVPLGTVQKIFSGETSRPRYGTLQALEKAFSLSTYRYPEVPEGTDRLTLREPDIAYGTGRYTIEDYYKLPDDRRVELIDGVFYDMGAPTSTHQLIAGQLYAMFLSMITEHGRSCIPFIAPSDVQLHCDEKTIMQPDVYIVCDRNKIKNRLIYGAPDLVVEILSPSTRKMDMGKKLMHYMTAGVREYWIIDPDRRKVMIYNIEDSMDLHIYGFRDSIPVGICEGCYVDFARIDDYVSFLYEES
ncbi:MAG: Uma2 family endonuclease [Eubacterium sp.]|nr:Uma2 family endonuclease [Eubacterium sp.]